jgi:hypothetical protein
METQVRTPQMVFMQPQRLVVPLFQRPYVWSEENQWDPLWIDITRVAERVLQSPTEKHHPHFLGAVVLQQVQRQTGHMQERTVIDGQQRLTTLQLLLDALHAELVAVGAEAPAARIEPLVSNAKPFQAKPEDRFKVWPTNRDRPPFNAVMGTDGPVDHDALGFPGERMVEAHRFFSQQAREWLAAKGPEAVAQRAGAIEGSVRELLQMVVIDLAVDENAQEIFETLNGRGAQLTAADLIKNFIFQRLLETDTDIEAAYQANWKEFETAFWETEISVGRLLYPRSSIFLNHWLVARTGEEVLAREVFERFKRYTDHEAGVPMSNLLSQIRSAADIYREFATKASAAAGPVDRLGLFGYRVGVLESEVVKPLILTLRDPQLPQLPDAQFAKVLDVLESWMVRRMLVRATTKNYGRIIAELVAIARGSARATVGDAIERYFAAAASSAGYWPDDAEIREELSSLLAYRRLSRGRLRMVLEAVEDHLRGWRDGRAALGEERVARGKLAIEHVLPRKWHSHWPLPPGMPEADRDRLLHTLGNLTLLTGKLNSKVSNGPWLGSPGKKEALAAHDVLLLNRELVKKSAEFWDEESIRARTRQITEVIIAIWPVPEGHRTDFQRERPQLRRKLQLSDLIAAGALHPGPLFPRHKKFRERSVSLLSDGRIEVDGQPYATASEAARQIAGRRRNGLWFFLVDQASRRSLSDVRRDYVSTLAVDVDDDPDDDEEDDD